jgi:hypothetical protein
LFFSPLENLSVGIIAFISFILIIFVIGDSLRILLKISLLHPFTDSLFLSLLFTAFFGLLFDFFGFFNPSLFVVIFLLFIVLRVTIFLSNHNYKTINRAYLENILNKAYLLKFKTRFINYIRNVSQSQIVLFSLLLYFIFFIISPAIFYPLPFQDDMKHHSLFVYLMYSQETVFPTWNPITPTYSSIIYQLGGHVFTTWMYSIISFSNVPIVTFTNFIFKFFYITLFFTIVLFVNRLYPQSEHIFLSTSISLLLIPSLFFVTRWGGFSWLFGLFLFIYLVFLSLKPLIKELDSFYEKFINQTIFLIGLLILGFFHVNTLFYFFLYLTAWALAVLVRIIPLSKSTITFTLSSFFSIICYYFIIQSPQDFLKLLPEKIQLTLTNTSTIYPEGSEVDFTQIFLFNFFLGGVICMIGLIIFLITIRKQIKSYSILLLIWTIIFLSISIIIQVFRDQELINSYFSFPGAQFVVKSERMLYFSFIMLIIYAPSFWNKFHPFFMKINKNSISILFICAILGFSLISFYIIEIPETRGYNSYTIEGYQWVKENIPENSYIMNDLWGQWLPQVANIRVSLPYDPLYHFAQTKTPYVFFDLLTHVNNTGSYDSVLALSGVNFNISIDYIFITHHVVEDVFWKMGQKGYDAVVNVSIYSLDAYPNLIMIYSNPDVAIYSVI